MLFGKEMALQRVDSGPQNGETEEKKIQKSECVQNVWYTERRAHVFKFECVRSV